ncbi:MAG: DUF2812 domain-containing protein [Clostridiaceae bacterium]
MSFKDTKRVLFKFSPYECTAVEEYLEEMAQEGWLLEAITMNVLKFKRIEPKKIKYSVDILHKVSTFDHRETDLKLEYREYCEAAGWKYLCEGNNGKIQVFYTEDTNNAVPIHTDQEEKFKSVIKGSVYDIFPQLMLILLMFFNIYMQLFKGNVEYTLATNMGIFSAVILLFAIVVNAIGITNFFIWVIRAKFVLKQNKFMPYNSYKQLKIKNLFNKVFILITLAILFVLLIFDNNESKGFIISVFLIACIPIIVTVCTKIFTNKKIYSRNTNRTITISAVIVSIFLMVILVGHSIFINVTTNKQEEVKSENTILLLSDYGFNGDSNTEIDTDKSLIAERTQYFLTDKDNHLSYTIFQSNYPWIIKFDEDRLIKRLSGYGIDLKQRSTKLGSNVKVYSSGDKKHYVLVLDNKVIEIQKDFDNIDEEEFLMIAYKKLIQ